MTWEAFLLDGDALAEVEAAPLVGLTGDLSVLGSVSIGTDPAQSGALRLENDAWIAARNFADSGDINLWRLTAADVLETAAPLHLTSTFRLGSTATLGYVLTADADGYGTWQVAGGKMGPTVVVAASDATAEATTGAHYVCDGTDDDVQIQAALDQVEAEQGRVLLTEGHFVTGAQVVVPERVTLEGMGWGTIITAENGLNAYMLKLDPGGGDCFGVRIAHMTLDGNGANQTAGGIIDGHGAVQCVFEHIQFDEPYDTALQLRVLGDASSFGHHNRVFNCLFHHGTSSAGNGRGIYMTSSDENLIMLCDFETMGGGSGTASACAIQDATGLNLIMGCVFVNGKYGININDSSQTKIFGCVFDGVGNTNIYGGFDRCTISANSFVTVGSGATDNTISAIDMTFNNENNIINGNTFRCTTVSVPRSFIRERSDGTPANNLVTGNVFTTDAGASIGTSYVERTNFISRGNVGINDLGDLILGSGGLYVAGTIETPTSVSIGVNYAASGVLKLENNDWMAARNAANDGDINMWKVNASNLLEAGVALTIPDAIGARMAFSLGKAGTIPAATTNDTADFTFALPYNMTGKRLKVTCLTKPSGDTTLQLRRSTNSGETFSDVSGWTVVITAAGNAKMFTSDPTDATDWAEGDVFNFSITGGGGDGTNVVLEVIGATR